MDTKDRVVIIFFDNHCFEKFKSVEEATGACSFLYTVDGAEVNEQEWRRQQEQAVARDLAALFAGRHNQKV